MPEQVAGRDAGEGDVPDAVADQAHPPLDEEEADRGREQPTIAPAANASRMNSESRMDVRGVVPARRELAGCAVEDDPAADEHEPLDVALDRAELVRDVEDRDAELPVELARAASASASWASDVDAGRRLVEDEQRRLAGERLGDEARCCCPPESVRERRVGPVGEPDALDRLVDERAISAAQRPEQAAGREPSRRDDLPYGGGRVDAELARWAR